MRKILLSAAGLAVAMTALLGGCRSAPRSASLPAPPASFLPSRRSTPVIGVLVAGWHTGLILPARELGPLRPVLPPSLHERYVSFGWGNRRFYMSPKPSYLTALAALLRSPSTVLVASAPHAVALLPAAGTYHWLCADRAQVWRIDRYVLEALRRRRGRLIELGAGPWPDSEFFASTEHYDAFHTCNTWTAEALRAAGLPVHAGGVIFSSQLRRRISRLRVCPSPSTVLPIHDASR